MEEEEIVDFIRSDDVFCFLLDLSVFIRGEKFRADGCIDDIFEDLAGFLIEIGIGRADNVRDHGFGNGAVHAVHGNMIAVEGAPSHCGFGKIARSDRDPIHLVGKIEQDLGAFARLCVFVDDIAFFRIVSDGMEVFEASLLDADLAEFRSEFAAETDRVVVGAPGGSESGHCHGNHIICGTPEQFECVDANKERERGIESARNSDHQFFRGSMLDTLGKSGGLDGEHFPACGFSLCRIFRNERTRRDRTDQRIEFRDRRSGNESAWFGIRHFHAFEIVGEGKARVRNAFEIDIGKIEAVVTAEPFRIQKNSAVFRNQGMTAADGIGRGFMHPRRNIRISGNAFQTLIADDVSADGSLSDEFIAGGKIQEHGRAAEREMRTRRDRGPEILADLDSDPEFRRDLENEIGTERDIVESGERKSFIPYIPAR